MLLIPSFWQSKPAAFTGAAESTVGSKQQIRHTQCHENSLGAELTFGAIFAEMRSMREKKSRDTRSCQGKRPAVSSGSGGASALVLS